MLGTLVRLIVSALSLLFVGFLVPGFRVGGFGGALVAAIAIALLGYFVERLFGKEISPQSRGLVGFLIAAVVIYLTQFVVPSMRVTFAGALLAALTIGVIGAFIPTELR